MGDISSWLGLAIQTVVFLGTVGGFVIKLHLDLKLMIQSQQQYQERMNSEITDIKERVKGMGQVIVDLARQDVRMNAVEARVEKVSNSLFEYVQRHEGVG